MFVLGRHGEGVDGDAKAGHHYKGEQRSHYDETRLGDGDDVLVARLGVHHADHRAVALYGSVRY